MSSNQDLILRAIKELKENFNGLDKWFTETRLEMIKSYIKNINSTPPEVQRAFEWFISNDQKPSLSAIRQRLYSEKERTKAMFRPHLKEVYDCQECKGTHMVFVKHPSEKSYLVMACDTCEGRDSEWSNFWDLPSYTSDFVKVDSPVLKLIKESNELGRMGLGTALYRSLVERTVKVCKASKKYFKERGADEIK